MSSHRRSPRGWSIEDFAASVLGGQSKHKAVAVIGYFDESGTSSQDDIAMYGGMIAKASAWATIEDEWRAKLAEYDLSEYHASHCEKGKKEYARFSKSIRDSLTNYFSTLVSRVPGQAICSGIDYRAWEKLVPEKMKQSYEGDPLYFSAALALQQISDWSRRHNDSEPVSLVFAHDDKRPDSLHKMLQDFLDSQRWPGLGSISFAKAKLLVPLQAADLICYEMKRSFTNPHEKRQADKNMRSGGKMGMEFLVYTAENLPLHVAKLAKLYPSLMD